MLNPADAMIRNNIAGGTYWFKVIRNDGMLTVRYSSDGSTYVTAFSTPLTNPSSSYNELLPGGITYQTAGSFANYSYVHITKPRCDLVDAPTYGATSDTMTMNFKIGTPAPATWNVWLTSHNMLMPLWSQAQPVADPPVTLTKTYGLPKSGEVGILSTLRTPDQGITCSAWQVVNTGD